MPPDDRGYIDCMDCKQRHTVDVSMTMMLHYLTDQARARPHDRKCGTCIQVRKAIAAMKKREHSR